MPENNGPQFNFKENYLNYITQNHQLTLNVKTLQKLLY